MSSGNSALFVIGPAGAGKSTFCAALADHLATIKRPFHLINLDPAAEHFANPPSKDIRDLITVEEAMDELQLGPNGALVFCIEYLLQNMDWLEEDLGLYTDEYLIIDCPGQIELYTHFGHFRQIVKVYQRHGYHVCCLYLLESTFLQDVTKFFAGVLNAMSAMMQLEVPHLNIISKMDLVGTATGISEEGPLLDRYLEVDSSLLADLINKNTSPRFLQLNEAIVRLVDEYNMVRFIPCNLNDEASLEHLVSHIDHTVQYGESLEPKDPDIDDQDRNVIDNE